MGGRGSYGERKRLIGGGEFNVGGNAKRLNLAGMNRDIARGVSDEKTLHYVEQVYKKGMTKEQLQILDKYGFVALAYQGDKGSVSFDNAAIKQMNGGTVTHNHPSGYGGTFSDADIRAATSFGVKSMRASAAEGVYSLRRTGKARPKAFAQALDSSLPALRQKMRGVLKRFDNGKNSDIVLRKLWVDVLHRWYRKNAPKYGYEYTFTPNKEYDIRKAK